MPFDSNVFINCPFDEEYTPMVKALIFTILYLNLDPQISITQSGSHIRIREIIKMIKNSKYSVHDLSRSKALKDGELPRFNIPYELGIDIGCIEFGGMRMKRKKILILESRRFHYQKVLSDIAGQDIQDHDDDPKKLIQKVRNWFVAHSTFKNLNGPTQIWNTYNLFNADLATNLKSKFTLTEIEKMPISEFIKFCKIWLQQRKK